jgi:hypothetical protein
LRTQTSSIFILIVQVVKGLPPLPHAVIPTPLSFLIFQRLLGATLLVFANKQDLPGALSAEEIKEVILLIIW